MIDKAFGGNAGKTRAEALLLDGEKHLNKFSFFGNGTKYEDAAECFSKAGNTYKASSLFQEAGDAYMKSASIYTTKLKSPHEATSSLVDAGNCYKKTEGHANAITAFRSAIAAYCEGGRFNQAAKLQKDIAEMYEKDGQPVEAIENYNIAADFFDTENAKSQAAQCMAKIAELCSAVLDPPDFTRSAEIYETLGKNCLDNSLTKYNAKSHLLASIFCLLALGDAVAARQKLDLFGSIDFSFRDSREGVLCDKLVTALEDLDADGFGEACFEFDRVSKLDGWKTSILVSIKRCIVEQSGGGSAVGEDGEVDLT